MTDRLGPRHVFVVAVGGYMIINNKVTRRQISKGGLKKMEKFNISVSHHTTRHITEYFHMTGRNRKTDMVHLCMRHWIHIMQKRSALKLQTRLRILSFHGLDDLVKWFYEK